MAILNSLLKTKKLGKILLDAKLLNSSQLDNALFEGKKRNLRLGAAIVNLGLLSEDQILDALSFQLSIKKVDLSKIIADPQIGKIIPENVSRQFKMVAISLKDNILTVALADPLDVFAADALKRFTDFDIEIVLAKEYEIMRTIDFVYMAQDISRAERAINIEETKPQGAYMPALSDTERAVAQEAMEAENVNIIKLVDDIIFSAAKNRASDIHIEPLEEEVLVRNRVDAELYESMRIPKDFINPIIARIKIMANMDIAEKRNAQDSRFQINTDGNELDIRVSVIPTINGEKAALRLLDKSAKILKISELGIGDEEKNLILKMIHKKYGLLLITGPTGSGKTTTAYSILSELNSLNKNIVTIEDPVEYKIKYINQVEANLKGGMLFAEILRAVLRQDPDIILVGEIRDVETARVAIQASLTGHFVISTVHTQDASSTISRLIDMGVEPFLLSSALVGVIGQRLLKKLCDKCKEPYTPPPSLIEELDFGKNNKIGLYKAKGCQYCRGTGFRGRFGIYELLSPDERLRKLMFTNSDASALRKTAIEEGFIPLRKISIKKALEGLTTIEEVLQATQDI